MEYRLQSLRQKYDLNLDDQKVEFLKAAAELLASVGNAVGRRCMAPGQQRRRGCRRR